MMSKGTDTVDTKQSDREIEERKALLDDVIVPQKRGKYDPARIEKLRMDLLEAELKVAARKKRKKRHGRKASRGDMIYSGIVYEEVYVRGSINEEAIYELKAFMPIEKRHEDPVEELRYFFKELKRRDPETGDYWLRRLNAFELYEYSTDKSDVGIWLFRPKVSEKVLIIMWDSEGYYEPFVIDYRDIDFGRTKGRLKLIKEVVEDKDFLGRLVAEGYLSQEAVDILTSLHGDETVVQDIIRARYSSKSRYEKEWYANNLDRLFHNLHNMKKEGPWSLNVELWEEAMKKGYILYKLSGEADMDTYFIKPRDFPFYLMFFGDIYGFLPDYYIQITEEKFKEYISKHPDLELTRVLEK